MSVKSHNQTWPDTARLQLPGESAFVEKACAEERPITPDYADGEQGMHPVLSLGFGLPPARQCSGTFG